MNSTNLSNQNQFNWQDGLRILLAVLTFGIGWLADNQATVISFVAMLIVWALGEALKYYGFKPGKAGLTVILFIVAFLLSLLFLPVTWPSLPAWNGDASIYVSALVVFLTAGLQILAKIIAYSMTVYNLLMAQVLDKLPATLKKFPLMTFLLVAGVMLAVAGLV